MSRFVIPALALAAAMTTANAQAQDTHTIVPNYADKFTTRTTHTSDVDQATQAVHQTTHSQLVSEESFAKADTGYKAVLTIVSSTTDIRDAKGNPVAQPELQKRMMGVLTAMGSADITTDAELAPVSIDNIETLKPKIKQMLTNSGDAKADAMGMQMYDAFIANLTPQSAAAFLHQAAAAGSFYRRPLVLHVPTPVSTSATQFMGATFNLHETMTLDDWVEGKSARITTVMAPTDEDMHAFMSSMVKNLLARTMTNETKDTKDLMSNVIDHMQMSMQTTCHTTVDLAVSGNAHTECDSVMGMTMDLAKALPPDLLKQAPQLAQFPPISSLQKTHTVTDIQVLP